MRTRCPNCGSTLSLDVLVAHEGAREALVCAFRLSGALGSAVCAYLGLFRPKERELSMDRVARLLVDITEGIAAGTVARRGLAHPAPLAAWVWALRQVVEARDSGRLKLPLKNHGYLYEVIASWTPDKAGDVPLMRVSDAPPAALAKGRSYAREAIDRLREAEK
jgi:hypothetical protein